jgi:hypothetical protein
MLGNCDLLNFEILKKELEKPTSTRTWGRAAEAAFPAGLD